MLNLFCSHKLYIYQFSLRELCSHEFMKCTFNIVMCQNTCELICFELGGMLNTTKLYSLISVWMALVFTQGHRRTGNLELVLSFCCRVAWSIFVKVDCVREIDDCEEKSCKYGEYGLFDLWLFLVVFDRYVWPKGCFNVTGFCEAGTTTNAQQEWGSWKWYNINSILIVVTIISSVLFVLQCICFSSLAFNPWYCVLLI